MNATTCVRCNGTKQGHWDGNGAVPPCVECSLPLVIVVHGNPVTIVTEAKETLGFVAQRALAARRETQPADLRTSGMDLRDQRGFLLDFNQIVRAYEFMPGATLFLSLRPGVGA